MLVNVPTIPKCPVLETRSMTIPVIDLFAGPGGLGEGFASMRGPDGHRCFDIRLSIEKDPAAHSTLLLRSFFRSFQDSVPFEYYAYLRGEIARDELLGNPRFRDSLTRSREEARLWELSEENHPVTSESVRRALNGADSWVLIGGPPCQAYSVVGRARRSGESQRKFEKDKRHFLYREYLRVIADHHPALFVMENVRGILSSTIGGNLIFRQILRDLERPDERGPRYRVMPLSTDAGQPDEDHDAYLIRSEEYGIPQTRHRVFIIGIREDIPGSLDRLLPGVKVTLGEALNGLPRIRSRLSRIHGKPSHHADSHEKWHKVLASGMEAISMHGNIDPAMWRAMREAVSRAGEIESCGARFMHYEARVLNPRAKDYRLQNWYADPLLTGVSNHEARAHMDEDLHRYLFAAAFALTRNCSPKLRDFPVFLLPRHRNALKASILHRNFTDRFKVQLYGEPGSTVVSHIAKDGHYFIHPDPAQCRSLTVREAARVQTFPDNYHFEGNRTEQYQQVGNAVPPFLARQIAALVDSFIRRSATGEPLAIRPPEDVSTFA